MYIYGEVRIHSYACACAYFPNYLAIIIQVLGLGNDMTYYYDVIINIITFTIILLLPLFLLLLLLRYYDY